MTTLIPLAAAPLLMAAGDAASNGIDIGTLLSTGITPVIVVVLFMTRKIAPGWVLDSYKIRAESAEEQLRVLNGQMAEKVVPALTLATEMLGRIAPLVQTESALRQSRDGPRLDV